jgi:hypothetical protein
MVENKLAARLSAPAKEGKAKNPLTGTFAATTLMHNAANELQNLKSRRLDAGQSPRLKRQARKDQTNLLVAVFRDSDRQPSRN